MIKLTRTGTKFLGTQSDLQRACAEFRDRHCLILKNFVETELLSNIRRRLDRANFRTRSDAEGIGRELCLDDAPTLGLLNLALNNQQLFQFVQEVTRCEGIGCFQGRAYLFNARLGHYDSWHNDCIDNRLVAMSINLGPKVYTGGLLQIRERDSRKLVFEFANTGFGDALIFRISPNLEHRITEVQGDVPKQAFAGWFKSEPEFLSLLKKTMFK